MTSGRRSPSSPSTRRRWTAALALAYLLALFAQSLHVAQVRHAVCEHGHVVHAQQVDDAPEAARRPTPSAPVADAGLAAPDEHHQHCPLAVAAPCAGIAVATESTAASLSCARPLEAPPPEVRVRSFALYLLAPHHSPPAGWISSQA